MSEYRELFAAKIANLKIGVSIINAGFNVANKFEDCSDEFLETTMNINAIHVFYLAKILSEKLLANDGRSAMIFTSSLAANRPIVMSVAYSAQKIFTSYIA